MSDPNDVIASIPDEDWSRAAKAAKVDVETLKAQLREVLSDDSGGEDLQITTGDATQTGDCITVPFEVSFLRILGLNGKIEFCPGSDWSATLEVCLSLLGNEVTCTEFNFNGRNLERCQKFEIFLASADICFGIRLDGFCLYIKGELCGLGNCTEIDETIHCFG